MGNREDRRERSENPDPSKKDDNDFDDLSGELSDEQNRYVAALRHSFEATAIQWLIEIRSLRGADFLVAHYVTQDGERCEELAALLAIPGCPTAEDLARSFRRAVIRSFSSFHEARIDRSWPDPNNPVHDRFIELLIERFVAQRPRFFLILEEEARKLL